jgi:hypothetical protein
MKKNFGTVSLAMMMALVATSCGKETIETPDNTDSKIAYKAALGTNRPAATRAKEINVDRLIAGNAELPVWVYFKTGTSANNLFKKWSLTYLTTPDNHWSYNSDVDVIHPSDDLEHFSVWPVTNITTANDLDMNAASGEATFEYLVPDLHTAQDDLLVAQKESTYSSPRVQFTYHHALSQINFSVKGYTGVKITISNIKMGDICNKATYSFATNTWSGHEGSGAYDYVIEADQAGDPVGQTTGDDDNEVFFGNHDTGVAAEKDIDHDNSLMLLPQNFANTDAWFSFDYVLTNMDGVVLKSDTGVTVPLKDLSTSVWENGSRYRYTINFNTLNTISYDVTVSDWTESNQVNTQQ